MEILSTFSFKDLIAFAVPVIITALFFNRRRKRKSIRVNCSFLFIVLSVGSALEIWGNIYETFSYRNNHLYNNDKFTTVFNYDIPKSYFFHYHCGFYYPFHPGSSYQENSSVKLNICTYQQGGLTNCLSPGIKHSPASLALKFLSYGAFE
jgi:hypothetical protein